MGFAQMGLAVRLVQANRKLQRGEQREEVQCTELGKGWVTEQASECHLHRHREKLAVRSCLAAGSANRQLQTAHFIFGGGDIPTSLQAKRGEVEVFCISKQISYLRWLYLFVTGLTVTLVFAAIVDGANLWRLAFGTAGS